MGELWLWEMISMGILLKSCWMNIGYRREKNEIEIQDIKKDFRIVLKA